MIRTRLDERGQVVEIPPAVLACGCEFRPSVAVIGYNAHPSGVGRARCYYCHEHRVWTWEEHDPI
ncbi:MAG: hypothetical protein ABR571_10120 [Jatrophihabitans sp.]|uniref:hypothetical protein n=1 Tax=Jatrophihabitans sp. TaxID=1932789 RepID=UPI0039140E9E